MKIIIENKFSFFSTRNQSNHYIAFKIPVFYKNQRICYVVRMSYFTVVFRSRDLVESLNSAIKSVGV
jgi:hypothetical protein